MASTSLQVHLRADPQFSNNPRSPSHQQDIEQIRRWTRECLTVVQSLAVRVNNLTARIEALEAKP